MKNYIVFDLEWNQSPTGKEGSVENIPFEIIEIGAVKLNDKFEVISEFHELIKPKVYKKIHYKISEVTHMNMAQLRDEGKDFAEVMRLFISWCGKEAIFCTWGSMDLTELQRNMTYYRIEIPCRFPVYYYDVQKLYALLYDGGKIKASLDHAVEFLNLTGDRPFHRALDDAYYTSMILKTLDFEKVKEYLSIDYYQIPQSKKEEVYFQFPNYSKYISRGFASKEAVMEDKNVKDVRCYKCNRMLRKKIHWFPSNQKFYFCIAVCPEHGYVKGKIRLKKAEDGTTYAVKTIKLVDEENAQTIFDKKEEVRKKRNIKNKIRKLNKKISPGIESKNL